MKVTIKELTIESDSDFSHVNIDFSKGSMNPTVTPVNVDDYTFDKTKETTPNIPTPKKDVFKDSVLDLDEDFVVEEEVVEKPVIEETKREVLVSDDMQSATY